MEANRIFRFPVKYLFVLPYILIILFVLRDFILGTFRTDNAFICLSGILCAVVVFVSGGYLYYQLFHMIPDRMEGIRIRYSLSVPEKIRHRFFPYLLFVLDMVDHTLDVEYSNQLMRKQAEFDSMKSQINPHFLYNTLDSIRGFALMENAPIAADMIEILSRIFRYSISQKNDMIMIREELKMVQDYIAIQEYRLSNHIVLSIVSEEEDLLDHRVPKLIIQPFVENAIKYGVRNTREDLCLTIRISHTDQRLIMSVADNGSGMTLEKLTELNEKLYENQYGKSGARVASQKGSGIAIVNVNARLRLLYGDDYGVVAFSTPGVGSEFQITVPYREELPDEQRTIADRASELPKAGSADTAVSFR